MKIHFLGGASSIGASCILFEVGKTRIVVDCGIRMGNADSPLPDLAALGDRPVDAFVLTHAHTDHSGAFPVVIDAAPRAPVYATPPTAALTKLLLRDSLKLMKGAERDGEIPLYAERQLDQLSEALSPLGFGQSRRVGDIEIAMLPASHILGAAMLYLQTTEGNVLVTGDYSVSSQLTVPALTRPALQPDLVITESTYGDRLHEDRVLAEKRLVDRVKELVEEGARVLIPAFALGRAQEVLLILKRALRRGALPEVPVFVDGMVRSVCGIYARHERYVSHGLAHDIRRDAHPFYANGIRPVESPADRAKVLSHRPSVIVASSGMLAGGASTFYASEFAAHAQDAILITGYQDEESPGRALLALAARDEARDEAKGARRLLLAGKEVDVSCRVEKYGLSAHADRMQMVGLLSYLRPRTAVLVHGDAASKRILSESLAGDDVVVAEDGMILERRYRPRQRGRLPRTPVDLDVDAARRLLGPPTGKPLRARQIAEALWGEAPARAQIDRLIDHLEELGLARRDDERRGMIWVLGPSETSTLEEEAQEETRLKEENPKGRLLELCMKRHLEAPHFHVEMEGAYYVASASLSLGESREPIEATPQRASSKKMV